MRNIQSHEEKQTLNTEGQEEPTLLECLLETRGQWCAKYLCVLFHGGNESWFLTSCRTSQRHRKLFTLTIIIGQKLNLVSEEIVKFHINVYSIYFNSIIIIVKNGKQHTITNNGLLFVLFFWDRVSPCSIGWPQIHDPPTSASWDLGL
jgi:hypothetical protein